MDLSTYIQSASLSSPSIDSFKFQLYQRHLLHYSSCFEYKVLVDNWFPSVKESDLSSLPYLPVSSFKNFTLKSISDSDIFKTLRSSGTSGQTPSRIFLDRTNARAQSLVLSKLFSFNTGLKRPNILIIDSPETVDRNSPFTARKAGIVGFSSLCRKKYFALNADFSLNIESIERAATESSELLLFGFTYIIWQHLLSQESVLLDSVKDLLRQRSVLLHGGGWKKLVDLQISNNDFNRTVSEVLGTTRSINYYGMVEQTGSIFFECPLGFLHTNSFAHVVGRDPSTLQPSFVRNVPLLCQVLSALPTSYPGHSILTDDVITLHHFDDCPCGQSGTAFRVNGRLPKSEPRGCSDTFSAS